MFVFTKRKNPGLASDSNLDANSEFDSSKSSSQSSISSANATQQELIRVAFKDTLRATGVPPAWLSCEVHLLTDSQQLPRMQVHLVIKKWSGHLLRYSLAFQNQMRACLDRYEPDTDHSAYEWLWKYAPDCDAPFPAMPAPEEWVQKLAARSARKPNEFFERRKRPRTPKS